MATRHELPTCSRACRLAFLALFRFEFDRDTDAVMNDLLDTLSRMGIAPMQRDESDQSPRYTDHRVVEPELASVPATTPESDAGLFATLADGIGVGDRVVLLFSDDQKRMSVLLAEDKNDLENGRLSKDLPLGKAVLGAEEGDEVEFRLDDKRVRKVLIEKVEKGNVAAAPMAPGVASMIEFDWQPDRNQLT